MMNKMDSTRCRGFTLTELIVVIAIVCVLTALSFPVLRTAKVSAKERALVSSLQQAYQILEMYRQDYDASTNLVGTSSQLGLPGQESFGLLMQRSGLEWGYEDGKIGYGPVYYPADPGDSREYNQGFKDTQVKAWLQYNRKNEGDSVIIGNFNLTTGCGKFPTDTTCLYFGHAISLGGRIYKRQAAGNIYQCGWWEK